MSHAAGLVHAVRDRTTDRPIHWLVGPEDLYRVVIQILLPEYCHQKDLVLGFQVAWEGGGSKDLTTLVILYTSRLIYG